MLCTNQITEKSPRPCTSSTFGPRPAAGHAKNPGNLVTLSRAPRRQADICYVLIHAARVVSASSWSLGVVDGGREAVAPHPQIYIRGRKKMEARVQRTKEGGEAGAGAGGRAANDQNADPNVPTTPRRGDGGKCASPRTSLPSSLVQLFSELDSAEHSGGRFGAERLLSRECVRVLALRGACCVHDGLRALSWIM
jgi:hypothetical protein